uniref:hypothetical protein n=1 Tax=Alloprevotella sp. TaxID=1872471 RepID=UPI003FD8293F
LKGQKHSMLEIDIKLLPFQGAETLLCGNPGCRFACPGLCAPLGFQPALAKSETSVKIAFFFSLHYLCKKI